MHGYKCPINCHAAAADDDDDDDDDDGDDDDYEAAAAGDDVDRGRHASTSSTALAVHVLASAGSLCLRGQYTGACTLNRPCAQQYVGKISVMHGYKWPMIAQHAAAVTRRSAPCCFAGPRCLTISVMRAHKM